MLKVSSVEAYKIGDQPQFEHITSAEGLSHDTVYSIAQDQEGFLWFGTEDGLNRFDGYDVEILRGGRVANSIGNANCAYLYIDDSNSIWIASWGGGLEVLNLEDKSVRTYSNDPLDPNTISDNNIHHIFQDSRGTIWLGTYTGGLNRFDAETSTFVSYKHDNDNPNSLSNNRVWWISENQDGSLLIATNAGLDRFDPENESITHYTQVTGRVRTMLWDQYGTLWLGTQNGLCRFDPETGNALYFLHVNEIALADVITSICEDSYGRLWVGSSYGINTFDRITGQFSLYIADENNVDSLSNNDVRVIFEDRSGNLWIGTRGGGINKLNIKPRKFELFNMSQNNLMTLSNSNINSIFQDSQGIIWVGTNDGGLNRFDWVNKTQQYLMTDITQEKNRHLYSIEEDATSLWIGSLGGLNRLDKTSGTMATYIHYSDNAFSISHNTILSLIKDHSGTLWVGTLGGLNRYDAANDRFIRYLANSNQSDQLNSNSINCLYEDSYNQLWIGTSGGLHRYIPETETFVRYVFDNSNPSSLSDNLVYTLFEDNARNLWIGTQYGLNRFNRDSETFTIFTTEQGLPNNNIRAIRQDDNGLLWISTNRGISSYNPIENRFSNFDVFDGLQGNSFNANVSLKTIDGKLLFGGTNGLNLIDPDMVVKSSYKPGLVITGFRIMDDEVDYLNMIHEEGKILLSYREKNLWLKFASLDYTNVLRLQYAYKLEGFNDDWIYLDSQRTINFTNLPSGNYVLRIIGTNSDGVWNEEGVSIPIRVSPPWWLSTFAFFGYGFLIIGSIILISLYYANRNKRKVDELQKMIQNAIGLISRIGEMRDLYTAGHQKRVQQLSCSIARQMKLSEFQIMCLSYGAQIHDIGKINIPSDILNKPGKITNLEYQILQTHVEQGYNIIKQIEFPKLIIDMIYQHHERLDGSGYPQGLSGNQIIMESRILAVADVVEAMMSNRPYREALGIELALDEILLHKGTRYDADVVDVCVALFKENKFSFSE
jgi:putative nucleotidyltransferase with HDIG domain